MDQQEPSNNVDTSSILSDDGMETQEQSSFVTATIDLTVDDYDETEIQEILDNGKAEEGTDEDSDLVEGILNANSDVQALLDAPSEQVAQALNSFFGNESEQEAVAAQRRVDAEKTAKDEAELKQQEEAEDLIIEDSIVKTDEEKQAVRRLKINEFLSWFTRLLPEQFKNFEFTNPNYLTESISDSPVVNVDKCKEIVKSFKESESLEGLSQKYELIDEDVLVAAICIGVLDTNNEEDVDFNVLCDDRIDDWSIEKCVTFLDYPNTGLNSKNGPLRFMQFTVTSPASAILMLTLIRLREEGHPCRLDFDSNPTDDLLLNFDQVEFSNNIIDTAVKYWDDQKENGAQDKIGRELNDFFHEIESTSAEFKQHFENAVGSRNEIIQLVNEKIPDFDGTEAAVNESFTSDQRTEIINSRAIMETLKAEMKLAIAEAQKVYDTKTDFEKFFVLTVGDFCLARANPSDDAELTYAIVQDRVDAMTYKVKFIDTSQIRECNIRDLAMTTQGMYDPSLNTFGDVGLRVACRQVISSSQFGKKTIWLTGTAAGRRRAHRSDFLIFFDNGTDAYVSAPTMPGEPGYEVASEKKSVFSLKEMIAKMNAAQIAIMVGQPVGKEGNLDYFLTFHWIRQSHRSAYIRDFMKEFPEWPLLKMPVGMRICLYNSLVDRRKKMVTVIGTDRAFAIVRHEAPNPLAPGNRCTDFPCNDRNHQHIDEKIYRGSHRLEGAAHKKHMISTNNNLSQRRKDQLQSQFEPTDMIRSMPERNHQQVVKKKTTGTNQNVASTNDAKSKREIEIRKKNQFLFNKIIVPIPVLTPLENLKAHAQCGPDCLQKMDADPYEARFHRNSPIHTPLLCGWRRIMYTMSTGKKRGAVKKNIIYFSPCGAALHQISDVSEYIHVTRSLLTIDCFSFDARIDTATYITVDDKYLKVADFSLGTEGIPIPLVNSVDNDEPPSLEYSKRRFQYNDQVDISSVSRDFCSGCSCDGDCSDASKCECQQLSIEAMKRLPHNLQFDGHDELVPHYQNRLLSSKVISGLYECNDQCSCHRKSCYNRVVQNNIKYPMHIFKTAQSGWGVRALTDIPQSTFICTYVGAILTDDLADELRNADQYFADLDLKDTVELEKGREDHETDFGYGGDESDYDDEEGSDGDSGDDVMNKMVKRQDSSESGEETKRLTRQKRKQSKKSGKGGSVEKDDTTPRDSMEKDNIESKDEPVFNWDKYFEPFPLYVIDAKQRGNLGRFLNHSCDPNVHVQHVMYDTHDLRLPWVAFFTRKYVKAGDELTWDYQYTQDQTATTQLTCHCGAENCTGRLLKS